MHEDIQLTGAIGFSFQESWNSKIQKFFTGNAEYTHTFVVVDDLNDRLLIQHALLSGVMKTTMRRYLEPNAAFVVYMPTVSKEKIDKALNMLELLVGKRYGILQWFGYGLMFILHKLGLKKKNPFGSGMSCSEMAWKYVKELGLGRILGSDWEEIDDDDVTPDDIYGAVSKLDGDFRFVLKKKLGETMPTVIGGSD